MKNIALITWASSWIGKELATVHAERWGDMILVARSENKLKEIKIYLENKYNSEVMIISKDLTTSNSPKELYDEIKLKWIEVDYLINNAWVGWQWFFHERNWEDDKNMIQLNVITLTELTKYFVEDMVKRGSWKILNVSSTASFMPWPLQAVYYASKSFVQFFSNALSKELEWTWVTVTNLMPWATETSFAKAAWLEKTDLFKLTFPATGVAIDGYNAMIKWKMDIMSGLTLMQRISMWSIPFVPKKIVLNMIFDLQSKAK